MKKTLNFLNLFINHHIHPIFFKKNLVISCLTKNSKKIVLLFMNLKNKIFVQFLK